MHYEHHWWGGLWHFFLGGAQPASCPDGSSDVSCHFCESKVMCKCRGNGGMMSAERRWREIIPAHTSVGREKQCTQPTIEIEKLHIMQKLKGKELALTPRFWARYYLLTLGRVSQHSIYVGVRNFGRRVGQPSLILQPQTCIMQLSCNKILQHGRMHSSLRLWFFKIGCVTFCASLFMTLSWPVHCHCCKILYHQEAFSFFHVASIYVVSSLSFFAILLHF